MKVSAQLIKRALLVAVAPLIVAGSALATVHADSTNSIIESLRQGIADAAGETYTPPSQSNSVSSPPLAPTPPPVSGNSGQYAALGDSVAAGLGLNQLPQATAQDTACGRSSAAYPALAAKALNVTYTNYACSGAKAGDLFTDQDAAGMEIPPQLDAAFSQGKPTFITITAGANDAHWVDFIRLCYVSRCDTKTATSFANTYLETLQIKLYYALFSIYERSGQQPPRVYLTGYYDPFSASCQGVESRITSNELAWLEAEQSALNQTLQNVASQYHFVTYVPVSFSGHDICSNDSWVQGPDSAAPFHPTLAGQQAIAKAVVQAYHRS